MHLRTVHIKLTALHHGITQSLQTVSYTTRLITMHTRHQSIAYNNSRGFVLHVALLCCMILSANWQ